MWGAKSQWKSAPQSHYVTNSNKSNLSDFRIPVEYKNHGSRYQPNSGVVDNEDGKGYLNCQVDHRLVRCRGWDRQHVPRCRLLLPTNSNQHFHSKVALVWKIQALAAGYSRYFFGSYSSIRANRNADREDIDQTRQRWG